LRLIVKGQQHPESSGTHLYMDAVEIVDGQLLDIE